MGRKVFVSSDMSIDERLLEVAEIDSLYALMWPWFITACDDWGRADASTKRLKASVFPGISAVTPEVIGEALDVYSSVGLISLYEVDGRRYFCIKPDKWFKWQTHIRAAKRDKDESKYPAFLEESQVEVPARKCAQMRADACKIQPSPSPSPSPSPTPSKEGDRERGMGETTSCDASPDVTDVERKTLAELKAVDDYPFDYAKDLKCIRALAVDFPDCDLWLTVKDWATYKLDHPLEKKSNPRSQLRTWFRNEKRFKKQRDKPRVDPYAYARLLREEEERDKSGCGTGVGADDNGVA
jgi:hypothetical protein